MKLDVAFTPSEIAGVRLDGRTVIVMDVLRATSTIVEALENGAKAVIPVDTVERAVRTAADLGGDVVLCGERQGLRINGFDFGNSPREFAREAIEDRTMVMSTTNGTRALLAASEADAVLVGSLLNADAIAAAVEERGNVLLLCAGRQGRFALEDAVCAGVIARRIAERADIDPTDSARAAIVLAGRDHELPEGFLRSTAAAENLRDIGLGEDVEFCGRLDSHDVVPRLRDHRITLQ